MSILDKLEDSAFDYLDRRIDNEFTDDVLPSPHQSTNETPQILTSDNELGRSKEAGTGSGFFAPLASNPLYVIGAGLLFAGFAYMVITR